MSECGAGRPLRIRRDDRGAGVAEFVLMTFLLVLLLFAVLQVALWFYARTVVSSAAADAARYAAVSGGSSARGDDRARGLLDQGLAGGSARQINCHASRGVDATSGLAVETVECTGRVRMIGLPFDVPLRIDVRSSSLIEGGR